MSFNTIPEGIESIRQGEILVVVDAPDRENEGDLVMAAEKATPEAINFMAKYGRGMICLPATSQRLKELELFEMVSDNTSKMSTAFTVTIDAKEVKTGISAQERSMTIQQFINPIFSVLYRLLNTVQVPKGFSIARLQRYRLLVTSFSFVYSS